VEKEFGNFASDNKSNEFMTSINIYKFKAYSFLKLSKVFTNQYHTKNFDSSRKAFYFALFGPPAVIIGFFIISPLSVYRNIAIGTSIFGG
jgi:hypothetical protein